MPTPTGYAVEVVRRSKRASGRISSDGLHCGFWHHPIGMKPREIRMDGVPFAQPANARQRPILIFKTMEEADIAADYFNAVWGKGSDQAHLWREDVFPGEYVGYARAVQAAPTHRLSDNGFQALPDPTSLFP